MPDFVPYGGTITFDTNYCIKVKNGFIENFTNWLKEYLIFNKRSEYYIKVAKEFHKVDGIDDYEAPHIHFILYSKVTLSPMRVRAILKALTVYAGRSQFYRMTELKAQSYARYIQKDVGKLNCSYYEMYIEPYVIKRGQVNCTCCGIPDYDEDYDISSN